jgi:putative oxidoreductase
MNIRSPISPLRLSAAVMALRIANALAFLYHGSVVLFGAFGGPGPQGFSTFMHMPIIVGGAGTVWRGPGNADGCVYSIWRYLHHYCHARGHLPGTLTARLRPGENGYEYALTQLLIPVAILILGPGDFSLRLWRKSQSKPQHWTERLREMLATGAVQPGAVPTG